MTTTGTLFACAASDVTLERIRELVAGGALESLTLEFKETRSPNITKTIAGMANSYGGLILVGIKEQKEVERVVGAPAGTLEQIANSCQNSLEPPWVPEIIAVPLTGENDRYVFVIRIHTDRAPRPILLGAPPPSVSTDGPQKPQTGLGLPNYSAKRSNTTLAPADPFRRWS